MKLASHNRLFLAVVDQRVGGIAGNTLDDVLEAVLGEVLAQARGRLAQAQEVSTEASNVRRGHGGAGDGVGVAAGPGAGDVSTGSEDIDKASNVGVGGERIVLGGGTDGAGARLRGGRVAGGIRAVVASGDSKEEASVDDGGSGLVDRVGLATTQGHVHDNTLGACLASGVLGDKLHAGNDAGVGARAAGIKDLHAENLGLLGNTVCLGANRATDVCAMAIAIGVVLVGVVGEELGTALEFLGCSQS